MKNKQANFIQQIHQRFSLFRLFFSFHQFWQTNSCIFYARKWRGISRVQNMITRWWLFLFIVHILHRLFFLCRCDASSVSWFIRLQFLCWGEDNSMTKMKRSEWLSNKNNWTLQPQILVSLHIIIAAVDLTFADDICLVNKSIAVEYFRSHTKVQRRKPIHVNWNSQTYASVKKRRKEQLEATAVNSQLLSLWIFQRINWRI